MKQSVEGSSIAALAADEFERVKRTGSDAGPADGQHKSRIGRSAREERSSAAGSTAGQFDAA